MREYSSNPIDQQRARTLETLASAGFAAPALLELRERQRAFHQPLPCEPHCGTSPCLVALQQWRADLADPRKKMMWIRAMVGKVRDSLGLESLRGIRTARG